jgi:single-stranded-DNA-specific exonuclease
MIHLPQPLVEVLVRRGITDIDDFLRVPPVEEICRSIELAGLSDASNRVLRAIKDRESIVLFGDYDCDGILGTAILVGVLRKLGARVEAYLPHRDEGYGFNPAAAFRFVRSGCGLIITIDNGMHAGRAVTLASRLGMDVIVIDHHCGDEELRAMLVWSESFSGASLAWLVAAALLGAGKCDDREQVLLTWASYAAIAAVADCVPLISAQRTLVRVGLQELARTRNPAIRKLLALAHVPSGEMPTARDIGFGVAPRINAAGRMAHSRLALQALFAETEDEAEKYVSELDTLNQQRKHLEQQILPQIFGRQVTSPGGLVFYESEWPRGIAGILAARAAEHFGRPAIILVRDPSTGELTGSGRSIDGVDLHHAVSQCTHLLTRFGGHPQAVGLSLHEESLTDFCEVFRKATVSCGAVPKCSRDVEADLNLASVSRSFWQACRALEPFGIGFPPFVFRVCDASIKSTRPGRARLRQGKHSIDLSINAERLPESEFGDFLVEITGRGARLLSDFLA